MSDANKQVVQRWFDEVWTQRRSEAIDELLAEESVCHSDLGPLVGVEGFRQQQYEPLIRAFPDLRVVVADMVAEGDQVVVRWSATGTHTGDGLPVAPTQRIATFTGISWIRIRDGQFREGWQASNIAQVIRELSEAAAASSAASV